MKFFNPLRRIKLRSTSAKPPRRIIVDFTPIRPGGENGGAKLLATELVRQFSRYVAPEYEYVLVTSSDTHDELAWLDAANVRRLCVNERPPAQPVEEAAPIASSDDQAAISGETQAELANDSEGDSDQRPVRLKSRRGLSMGALVHAIGQTLESNLPRSIYNPIYQFYRTHLKAPQTRDLLRSLDADLIFCPFTAPLYPRPGVPMVIIVYDLQYQTYPQFFSGEDLYYLDHYFRQSCQAATRLICISEYTRQSVLASGNVPPERVLAIPTGLFNRLETASPEAFQEVLGKYHLYADGYLLYPANFWPHKNHEMLLVAFSMFLSRRPESDLKLVLTGAPGERMSYLRQAAHEMGLGEKVLFPGFVAAQDYSALLQGCLAVIFPSLYEGFGAPVIEAMAFSKPALCSNLTSLPEVTQSAAHLFDPRKPDQIAAGIEKIQQDAGYRMELIERGRQRVSKLISPTDWASAYFDVFRQAMGETRIYSNAIYGVYPDHWAGNVLEIALVEGDEPRHLELTLEVPAWLPGPFLSVRVKDSHGESRTFRTPRGATGTMQIPLPRDSGKLRLALSPTANPTALGLDKDTRLLTCRVQACKLVAASRAEFLYTADR